MKIRQILQVRLRTFLWLFQLLCAHVFRYLALSDDSNMFYGAHGSPEVSYSKLETMVGLWDCIGSGECVPTIPTYWGCR